MLRDEKREQLAMAGDGSFRAVSIGRVRAAADRYEFKHQLSKNERLCDFLAFMAKEVPYAMVAANLCLRAVEGTARLTKDGTEETKRVRARASGARALLLEKHKRGLVLDPEGMRATVDDDDTMRHQQVRNVRRMQVAVASVRRTDDVVQADKLRDPELRAWKTGIRGALKAIEADKRIFNLIPQLVAKKE